MERDSSVMAVLGMYPPDCHARRITPLGGAGGFSGSQLWRLEAPRGELCLRLWPAEHPSRERLAFIHAVLKHVADAGFGRLPLPIALVNGGTYLEHRRRLWELAPWMPGEIDSGTNTRPNRIDAALGTLAEFHVAAATSPASEATFGPSPGLIERRERLERLLGKDVDKIEQCLDHRSWPELAEQGRHYLSLFRRAAPTIRPLLQRAAELSVPLQPCLRDIWRENVLFAGDEVSAILDFAAMRFDNVAGDIARLLGSFAINPSERWDHGLAAYGRIRQLSAAETMILAAFDRSSALLTGISWLDWVFRERREFADRAAAMERFQVALERLERLT